MDFSSGFLNSQRQFCKDLTPFLGQTFGGTVDSVQNPYEYAWNPYTNYVKQYLTKPVPVLLLGLNAGPNGMCVTGVPFGDYSFVTNWLGISGTVEREDPCTGQIVDVPLAKLSARREPSGTRLWTFIQDICKTPEKFFENCFVHNYCPLGFSGEHGNINPSRIKKVHRTDMEETCDYHLAQTMRYLGTDTVIAIGRYVEKRANVVINLRENQYLRHINVIRIPHPSPSTRKTEKKWREEIQGIRTIILNRPAASWQAPY